VPLWVPLLGLALIGGLIGLVNNDNPEEPTTPPGFQDVSPGGSSTEPPPDGQVFVSPSSFTDTHIVGQTSCQPNGDPIGVGEATVVNDSSETVAVTSVSVTGSGAQFVGFDSSTGTIPAGGTFTIPVIFVCNQEAIPGFTATLVIVTSAGTFNIPISMTVTTGAQ
jgi:hypothetical protein